MLRQQIREHKKAAAKKRNKVYAKLQAQLDELKLRETLAIRELAEGIAEKINFHGAYHVRGVDLDFKAVAHAVRVSELDTNQKLFLINKVRSHRKLGNRLAEIIKELSDSKKALVASMYDNGVGFKPEMIKGVM